MVVVCDCSNSQMELIMYIGGKHSLVSYSIAGSVPLFGVDCACYQYFCDICGCIFFVSIDLQVIKLF